MVDARNPLEVPGAWDKLIAWLVQAGTDIGAITGTEKFSVGQSNPTYKITTSHGIFVLRTQPSGPLLKSAHAVDREYRVMSALAGSNVPVPSMIAVCEDLEVLGVKWFLMGFVKGTTFTDPTLATLPSHQRSDLYFAQIDVLAALANTNPDLLGLQGFGKPTGYLERQYHVWTRQYRASEMETLPEMEFLIETLPKVMPVYDHACCVVHGDFRLDNLLFDDNQNVLAVIDWELSTLGPPLVDLSYWCTMLRMQAHWPIGGLGGIDRAECAVPSESDLTSRFAEKTGITIPDDWEIWIGFHCFRFAAILQGIRKRVADGNASADNASEVGAQAIPVAKMGVEILSNGLKM
ncbi:MAG: phosphotransferase family protein [Alphaproteobacteria bacterium]